MSYTPRIRRAWSFCAFYASFSILVFQGAYAIISFDFSGIREAILRPQAWQPEQIALVQEQTWAEVQDFSESFRHLFQEDAIEDDVMGEDLSPLLQQATQADTDGDLNLLAFYLQQALGAIEGDDDLPPLGEVNEAMLSEFALYVHALHPTGGLNICWSTGREVYRLWTLLLLNAVQSDSAPLRSRAYCELGFILRLNVFVGERAWAERIFECFFRGLDVLEYPEYLSLYQAFEHCLVTSAYSEEVRTLAFGCLLAMVFKRDAQLLADNIRVLLVSLYEGGLLAQDDAAIVDRLFIHPENLFHFSLM